MLRSVSSHRAHKHRTRKAGLSTAGAPLTSADRPGHRKAVRATRRSTASSVSALVGGAALGIAAIGAATAGQAITSPASQVTISATRHEGTYVAKLSAAAVQGSSVAQISRSTSRPDLAKDNGLLTAAQEQAAARKASLASAGDEAESYAAELEKAERQAERQAARRAARKAEAAERAEAAETAAAAKSQEPQSEEPESRTTTPPVSPEPASPSSGWVVPLSGYSVSSLFGEAGGYWSSGYHTGLDLAAPYGTPVVAAAAATVVQTGYDGAYGNQIRLQIDNGDQIWYNHLSSIEVTVGQSVSAGTPVGRVGETGNAYGAHLHLEYRLASNLSAGVDPVPYFTSHGVTF